MMPRPLRLIFVTLLALALPACATLPDITQSRSPCQLEPGGWCSFVRDAAVDAFPYALASTNAYTGDDDLFAHHALPLSFRPVSARSRRASISAPR